MKAISKTLSLPVTQARGKNLKMLSALASCVFTLCLTSQSAMAGCQVELSKDTSFHENLDAQARSSEVKSYTASYNENDLHKGLTEWAPGHGAWNDAISGIRFLGDCEGSFVDLYWDTQYNGSTLKFNKSMGESLVNHGWNDQVSSYKVVITTESNYGPSYYIIASHSEKFMDVQEVSYANGGNIQQWAGPGGDNQRWKVNQIGSNYEIRASHSSKCLDVSAFSQENYGNIHQWECWGGENQKWELIPVGEAFQLKAAHSGKCLDVRSASPENGANVIQYDCHDGPNQKWHIMTQDYQPFVLP
ncbi:MAG: RICIN domain-containing protein [Gammaproteobacteria bacterium]|jgi:hypothetical protein|nr:RICIN domain-containing protein [Gammaproteobacteria bacterium]MBT4492772.1 RICIN domain-containing protein [Gammaproteobacteria bacterium]MBT7370359.1 RICIN domain-containing protein [Gammaproteobacteria bacterium]